MDDGSGQQLQLGGIFTSPFRTLYSCPLGVWQFAAALPPLIRPTQITFSVSLAAWVQPLACGRDLSHCV